MSSLVSINLVVLNGEKYIRHCLDSVKNQSYENIEFTIWDNGSTDKTKEIIKSEFGEYNLVESPVNLGMWSAHEKLWTQNKGKYIVVLSVDVILNKDFVKNAVEAMEKDEKIGALQAKIYQWNLCDGQPELTKIIDTAGFRIGRSRRLTNIGHGVGDKGQFGAGGEIFAVEGAVPVFRREALESCRISVGAAKGEIMDHDFFWYSEDLDVAWRLRLMGWKEIYAPSVIAYHDRSTTKSVHKDWLDYFRRVKIRNQIPIKKRRLDWANYRMSIIKNDFAVNFLKDLPFIVFREIMVLAYALLFEQGIFLEIPRMIRLMPRMFKKRREIMRKAKIKPREMRRWFK